MSILDFLIKRRKEVLDELNQISREIEDAQTEIFKHVARQKIIVQRYFDGESIVVSFGRYWWVDANGDLLGLVDESDIQDLKELTDKGVFEKILVS